MSFVKHGFGFFVLSFLIVILILVYVRSEGEADAERIFFHAEYIFDPCPAMPMNHASTIAEMPDRDLLCAWYAGSEEGARDVKIYASRLDKNTGRWSQPKVIADTPDRSEGNPVLFVDEDGDGEKVWLYFVTIHGFGWQMAKMKYAISEDGGRTFGPPALFRKNYGWMSRNHILRLSNGNLIMPLYHESLRYSFFMRSTDKGRTWQEAGKIISRPGNEQPALVELDDGGIMALMRTWGRNGNIWQAESHDEGITWSDAQKMIFPNPSSAIDMIRLGNGHLVLAFNNSGKKRTPLTIALSEDQGKTWPYLRNLEVSEGRFSYPSLVQSSDSLIHITYTYKRITIKHAVFSEDWIREKGKEP
jgi:predicted neuraminidase